MVKQHTAGKPWLHSLPQPRTYGVSKLYFEMMDVFNKQAERTILRVYETFKVIGG